jgi:phosphoribosylformylglycinamidine synthase
MATVNVLVLRAPGTNCDGETCHAFALAGARPTRVHVNALLESPGMLGEYQVLVIPGGFCYGDDVAAGKILANQLRIGLADHLRGFRDAGKLIIGICNGFQVLIKSGLLPGWDDSGGDVQPATLANNDSGKFEDRWIHMVAKPGKCVFLAGIDRIDMPIAHGEGKFVCRDAAVLERLRSGGQVVLKYASPAVDEAVLHATQGTDSGTQYSVRNTVHASSDQQAVQRSAISDQQSAILPYPINPNGSQADIAGICDVTGRVFGLMPHPERHVDATQHPLWTRRRSSGDGQGLAVFRNAVRFCQ